MLTFRTTKPQALLNAFNKCIDDGDVKTWEKDKDGDFTHKAAQWKNRGWLRPEVVAGTALKFTILFSSKETEKRLVYSYYHGHMLETFLNHLSASFTGAEATPNPSGNDSRI
jgi:hypothetical protein